MKLPTEENAQLWQPVAELCLEKIILQDVPQKL